MQRLPIQFIKIYVKYAKTSLFARGIQLNQKTACMHRMFGFHRGSLITWKLKSKMFSTKALITTSVLHGTKILYLKSIFLVARIDVGNNMIC